MCTISDTKDTKQASPPPDNLCSLKYTYAQSSHLFVDSVAIVL